MMSGYLWGCGGTLLGLLIGSGLAERAATRRFRRAFALLSPPLGPIDRMAPTRAEITAVPYRPEWRP